MDIQELVRLANWFDKHTDNAISAYESLTSVLQHNAQQANKLPVQKPLNELMVALNKMPTQQLTKLQLKLLEQLEVADLIGEYGAVRIEETVKTQNYDPATTFNSVQISTLNMQIAKEKILALRNAAIEVGIDPERVQDDNTEFKVSITFRADVAISNIRDWKNMAADWEKIFSGFAEVVEAAPEDVKVAGFGKGSIVLTLVTTAAIVKIVAMIAKHITGIAYDIILVRKKFEELKQLQMITDTMAQEFEKMETNKRKEGKDKMRSEIDECFPDLNNDVRAKLDLSIDKILSFGERGGEIDFSVPDDEGDIGDKNYIELKRIRSLIEEQRETMQKVKLLNHKTQE